MSHPDLPFGFDADWLARTSTEELKRQRAILKAWTFGERYGSPLGPPSPSLQLFDRINQEIVRRRLLDLKKAGIE